MTEEKKEGSHISAGVAISFIFLFLIFLLIKNPKTTGLATAITGSAVNNSPSSTIVIVVITLVLILALGASFFFFKKMKQKKGLPQKEAVNLSEEQIEKLFSEEQVSTEKPQNIIEISSEKLREEIPKEKPLVDNYELKKEIRSLISKGISGQGLLNRLIKNYTKEQIEKAIEEINHENLRFYIQRTLNEGFTKERIKKALLFKNWPESQINRVFSEIERSPQPSKPSEKTEEKEQEELDLDLI